MLFLLFIYSFVWKAKWSEITNEIKLHTYPSRSRNRHLLIEDPQHHCLFRLLQKNVISALIAPYRFQTQSQDPFIKFPLFGRMVWIVKASGLKWIIIWIFKEKNHLITLKCWILYVPNCNYSPEAISSAIAIWKTLCMMNIAKVKAFYKIFEIKISKD